MEELIESGLIYETSQDDYILGGEIDIDKLIKERPIDHLAQEFNQKEINNSSCVVHAGLGGLGTTLNREFTLEERKEVFQYCKDLGIFVEGQGIVFYKGVDAIRNWWNSKNPNNKVMSFRITDLDTAKLALENGYRIIGGYQGNSAYTNDFNSDGKLDGTSFGKPTYGHCVSKKGDKIVIDNYLGVLKHNKYTIDRIEELIGNKVWFPTFYLFLTEKTMNEQLQQDIKDVELAIEKGITVDKTLIDLVKKGQYTPKIETLLMIVRANRILNSNK